MEGENQPVPGHGWRLDVRNPCHVLSSRSATNAFLFCSAGIAGINKTIAIASITQTSDLTYAIFALNTWVLTEMWFIIIFGSIPVLRLLFIRIGQSSKTPASSTFDHAQRSNHLNLSRSANDTWMPLHDRADARAIYDPSAKQMYKEESDDALPDRSQGRIRVTHETQIKREDLP